mmetsp:Transcript_4190/g.5925  ORF Transcript_4190/g.5925 Transcript_4190/m.5925 type:complete len:160 (-) Transcript_4190:695-1174(-)
MHPTQYEPKHFGTEAHNSGSMAEAQLQEQQRSVLPPPHSTRLDQNIDPPSLLLERGNTPPVAPIGPVQRPPPAVGDQEFIPLNADSPRMDRMQVFGAPDTPFTTSLFHSPFSMMFGPVTSYDGEPPNGTGLMAELNPDPMVFDFQNQRRNSEPGDRHSL